MSLAAFIQKNWKQGVLYTMVILVFAMLYIASKKIPEETIQMYVESAGVFAPLIWIFLTVLVYILAPLSGTPMLFVGFLAFGKMVIVYTLIAGIIGSTLNFYIAKYWGRRLVKKFVGESNITKIDKIAKKHGIWTLILLRIFQPNIHEFVSYAFGLTSMSYKAYITVTGLTLLPLAAIWYFATYRSENPLQLTGISILLSFTLSGVFLLSYAMYKKNQKEEKVILNARDRSM